MIQLSSKRLKLCYQDTMSDGMIIFTGLAVATVIVTLLVARSGRKQRRAEAQALDDARTSITARDLETSLFTAKEDMLSIHAIGSLIATAAGGFLMYLSFFGEDEEASPITAGLILIGGLWGFFSLWRRSGQTIRVHQGKVRSFRRKKLLWSVQLSDITEIIFKDGRGDSDLKIKTISGEEIEIETIEDFADYHKLMALLETRGRPPHQGESSPSDPARTK